jgi:hypothetical protein
MSLQGKDRGAFSLFKAGRSENSGKDLYFGGDNEEEYLCRWSCDY